MAGYKPGTLTNFSGSMAEAMETEFETIWRTLKGRHLPATGQEERRMLFTAIARGMMSHLAENASTGLVVTDGTGLRSTVSVVIQG